MSPSMGLLIFLLGWQLLPSQSHQAYVSFGRERQHTTHRPPLIRLDDAEPPTYWARPVYGGDITLLSKTTSPSPHDEKSQFVLVNHFHGVAPSIDSSYYGKHGTRNRTMHHPQEHETTTRSSRLTECQPPAANAILNFTQVGLKRIGDAFIESTVTRELYLDDNEIADISSTAFVRLKQLDLLSLSRNRIPIEKLLWFSTLDTLRTLIVDDNRYRSSNVSKVFESLPLLEVLSLQRDNISRFAVNVKEFAPRLKHLQLSGNKIDELDFLDDLPDNLLYLHLDDNRITKVRSIALKNLRELTVSGNQIESLCSDQCTDDFLSLKDMTYLQKLNASRNAISEVDEYTFRYTTNLMYLDLSRNSIKAIPLDEHNELSVLEELNLSHNRLGSVPRMCSLIRLKLLDLSYNTIGSVTANDVCNTTLHLRTLLLSGNFITNVDSDAFMQLPELTRLDLSNNMILDLPVRLIHEARSLQALLLRNNSIANIDQLFYARSNVLQELHLQENPFCTVRYQSMPRMVMYLKDQPQPENRDEETETEKDASDNREEDVEDDVNGDDENSVYSGV